MAGNGMPHLSHLSIVWVSPDKGLWWFVISQTRKSGRLSVPGFCNPRCVGFLDVILRAVIMNHDGKQSMQNHHKSSNPWFWTNSSAIDWLLLHYIRSQEIWRNYYDHMSYGVRACHTSFSLAIGAAEEEETKREEERKEERARQGESPKIFQVKSSFANFFWCVCVLKPLALLFLAFPCCVLQCHVPVCLMKDHMQCVGHKQVRRTTCVCCDH